MCAKKRVKVLGSKIQGAQNKKQRLHIIRVSQIQRKSCQIQGELNTKTDYVARNRMCKIQRKDYTARYRVSQIQSKYNIAR